MALDWFSPAQCAGYAAFALGVTSFLQTNDRRFKLGMTGVSLAYVVHYALLGNPTSVASSVLSTVRSALSLRTRSLWVAVLIILANLAVGWHVAERPADWLPLTASCLGTLAMFTLEGVAMRVVLLCATGFWISNNIINGSIGGTALELVVGTINTVTILRLRRQAAGQA